MISVYNKRTKIDAGPRKIELMQKYEAIVQRGRKDPCWFIETFFCVILTDYQRWIITSAWTKQTVCLVCSRNAGKSMLAALYIMARAVLFPSSKIWIMSSTAAQAQDTFTKLEDITNRNIPSISNENCIFANEVVKNGANIDGFIHDKSNYKTTLYNGSTIITLVGRAESIVGKRSNLSVFDEAAIIPEEFFIRAEPFTTQSSDFRTGDNIDLSIYPKALPNQNMYLSSAGDTSGHLWKVYKDCAKRMAMGFDDCFVADISCEMPLNPTIRGVKYPPLFSPAKVEAMMRSNPYRGLREYYNLFDQSGGTDMVVTRDAVLRNEEAYLPIFKNRNPDALYGLFYDPAHQADNSFVLATEYINTADKGWTMRLCNGVNLLQTLPNGDKKPMRSTEQLDWIHQLMLDYNGDYDEYVKLHMEMDPGSGGGGMIYSDFLMQEWQDSLGRWHHGVVDLEDETSAQEAMRFPLAVRGVLRLPNANKYKNEMYAALTEMTQQDLITFPVDMPPNGILLMDDQKVELSKEEMRSMLEMDLLKEEILMMRKLVTESGNVRYGLPADKERRMHDDRAYTAAMAARFLLQLRRNETFGKEVPKQDMGALLSRIGESRPAATGGAGRVARNLPFMGRNNPWRRR